MKITLLSDSSVRLEPIAGPMTIEAPSAEQSYSPFHMLGSSLAYCTWSILASWAANAKIEVDDLTIDVAWEFAEDPHRLGAISITFRWPALPEGRRRAAARVAEMCPIHATLSHPPKLTIEAVST